MPRFEKGSQEAKDYMAAIRTKRKPKYSAAELQSYEDERQRQRSARNVASSAKAEAIVAESKAKKERQAVKHAKQEEKKDIKSASKSKKNALDAYFRADKLIHLLRDNAGAFLNGDYYTQIYNILEKAKREADMAYNMTWTSDSF